MVDRVYTAPGNGGTPNNIPVQADDIDGLADFAAKRRCFTVVGPEVPLAAGVVDAFTERGLDIFGSTRAAARLEYSKAMGQGVHGPARYQDSPFGNPLSMRRRHPTISIRWEHDVVVKADGLAAGKGRGRMQRQVRSQGGHTRHDDSRPVPAGLAVPW